MMNARRILAGTLLAALAAVPASALMLEVPLEATADAADDIVAGRVVDRVSRWSEDGRTIVTDVTIVVDEVLKGPQEKGRTVTVRVEGGEVDDVGIRVEHQPRFRVDERVVVCLRHAPDGTRVVQSLEQGKFTVLGEQALDHRGELRPLVDLKQDLRRAAGEPRR